MPRVEHVRALEQIKLLADAKRLDLLRRLMAAPATLTQLGEAIGEHPAWVRHHVLRLEAAGLVRLVGTRRRGGLVERFYRASAEAIVLQELVLPLDAKRPSVVISGSHDLAAELLSHDVSQALHVLSHPIGSLDGLVALRQGLCHMAGCHLLGQSGEYNAPFVHHLFPDRPVRMTTLAYREQGLLVHKGNPKHLGGLADLARTDVAFINRNAGSGTRLWLDRQLTNLGLAPGSIRGYASEVTTHTAVAKAVRRGKADVGLGLHAAATLYGLDFIPLFHERYDLVYSPEHAKLLAPLLDTLQEGTFRRQVERLAGYETSHTGESLAV